MLTVCCSGERDHNSKKAPSVTCFHIYKNKSQFLSNQKPQRLQRQQLPYIVQIKSFSKKDNSGSIEK